MRTYRANDLKDSLKLKPFVNALNAAQPHVGILGAGASGHGAETLCKALNWSYEIVDEKRGDKPHFDTYDLIVFSPGFSPKHPWWDASRATSALCVNELDFAALCFDNAIIAVTGTNGKTSMVNLVTDLLNAHQQPALAVGNNGVVLSKVVSEQNFLKPGVFVCEVSSYQAWSLKFFHPKYTIWTNVGPDHLAYHGGLEAYIQAKMHLLKQTTHGIICGPRLKSLSELAMFPKVVFATEAQTSEARYPAGYAWGQRENFAILRTLADVLSIPRSTVERVLQNFKAPPHRLYCCRKWGDMEFWNDSKATNLHAVQSALETLKHKPNVHWILGGQDKGEDLHTFVQAFNAYPNVKVIYTIGAMGPQLAQDASQWRAKVYPCKDLNEVFKRFKDASAALVLSPGFASWDQYSSFEKRGEHFEALAAAFQGHKR